MSDPGSGDLQFERAERADQGPGLTCTLCQQAVTTAYFEINGQVTCQRCRGQVLSAWNRGSPGARFAKALGLGAGAAALGAALYFGIEALTGYEFGLVAIVVGLMVGGAVRKGSNGRGGWRYQALAMFLTYSAVVATDSSMIARELSKEVRAHADSVRAAAGSSVAVPLATASTTESEHPRPGPLAIVVGLAVLITLAYAAPILIGVASPIHLLIAGFALYEAWKLNRGAALRVTGPHRIAPGGAPA